MRTRRILLASCLIFPLLAGCGGDGSMATQAESTAASLQTASAGMLTEQHAHAARVAAAPDRAAIAAEESQHQSAMGASMTSMNSMMDRMGSCARTMGVDAGMPMMTRLAAELEAHRTGMATAGDLAACQAEESRHTAAMQALMDDMPGYIDALQACCAKM